MSHRYTKDHEWVCPHGDHYTVGISAHAARLLGDVVFVELPEVGKTFKKGEDMAVVESVKAASDIYAPISGEVVEVNQAIVDEPSKVNEHTFHQAWFVKLKPSEPSEYEAMMDEEAYLEFLESQE